MEHEYLDQHDHPKVKRDDSVGPTGAATPDLATQAGNRAFAGLVQRTSESSQGSGPLDPEIADEIGKARGGGRPLDDATKADMEGNIGADFSGVRVHTDANADALSRSVQAEAFTTGSDVFFRSGKFAPESTDGRRLLAHELTHVVQQSAGTSSGSSRVSHPDDPHEQEARGVGDAVANAAPAPSVDREGGEEEEEDVQLSVDRQGGEEEEEDVQLSVDREGGEEEEEDVQLSVDREGGEEEEEDVQLSVDRQGAEEEEEPMV